MLIVAPSGTVNDEMRRATPTFSSSVSMESGMVAFEVAVENAKPMTGANFRMNRNGLRPVNSLSRI